MAKAGESGQYIKGPLQANHRAAARLKAEGKSPTEIAAELSVKLRTVHLWFSDDQMKAHVNKLMDDADKELTRRMAVAGMHGIDALVGILNKQDAEADATDSMKLAAARELLDRTEATAKVADRAAANSGQVGNNYLQVFAQMGDEDLADFLKKWSNGGDSHPVIEAA